MSDSRKFVTNGQQLKSTAMDGKQISVEKFGTESIETRGLQSAPRTGNEVPPVQTAPRTITPMRGPKLPPVKR